MMLKNDTKKRAKITKQNINTNPFNIGSLLADLQELRDNRALVYFMAGKQMPAKLITDDDLPILYECLCRMEVDRPLDVIIHTEGGSINVSRRISQLLRAFSSKLNILVPYKTRSAGTLLCLGADNIIMGRLGELGPLDPGISHAGNIPAGFPPKISSEEIRAFQDMSKEWFHVNPEIQNINLVEILCKHIFPTTLSAIFRSHQQVCEIAEELLQDHVNGSMCLDKRKEIARQLTSGYLSHDYRITLAEAKSLGLNAHAATLKEESMLWQIWRACDRIMSSPFNQENTDGFVNAIIASAEFLALHIVQFKSTFPQVVASTPSEKSNVYSNIVERGSWQIIKAK